MSPQDFHPRFVAAKVTLPQHQKILTNSIFKFTLFPFHTNTQKSLYEQKTKIKHPLMTPCQCVGWSHFILFSSRFYYIICFIFPRFYFVLFYFFQILFYFSIYFPPFLCLLLFFFFYIASIFIAVPKSSQLMIQLHSWITKQQTQRREGKCKLCDILSLF